MRTVCESDMRAHTHMRIRASPEALNGQASEHRHHRHGDGRRGVGRRITAMSAQSPARCNDTITNFNTKAPPRATPLSRRHRRRRRRRFQPFPAPRAPATAPASRLRGRVCGGPCPPRSGTSPACHVTRCAARRGAARASTAPHRAERADSGVQLRPRRRVQNRGVLHDIPGHGHAAVRRAGAGAVRDADLNMARSSRSFSSGTRGDITDSIDASTSPSSTASLRTTARQRRERATWAWPPPLRVAWCAAQRARDRRLHLRRLRLHGVLHCRGHLQGARNVSAPRGSAAGRTSRRSCSSRSSRPCRRPRAFRYA